MIHIDLGRRQRVFTQLQDWLTAASYPHRQPNKGAQFNLSSMAIDAAIQGQKV